MQLSYQTSCIASHVELDGEKWGLVELVQDWINYYPTVRNHQQLLLCDIVAQEQTTNIFVGYGEYVSYLNLIALDLWKILRRGKREAEFTARKTFKDHLKDIR